MAPTAHPTIRVNAPQPNSVLNSGGALTVAGVATGTPEVEPSPGHPGAEAVTIDTVTVALAGGTPIEAALTRIPPQHPHDAPAARFDANLIVPTVGGNQQVEIVGHADNGTVVRATVPVTIQTHIPPPPPQLWANSQLAPAGALPGAARLTAIAKPVGCELWWIGTDGTVHGVWTEPGPNSAWANYQLSGGAAPGGGITAVSKGGDLMEVWWIGRDGSVQAAYHDGTWHLYTLAGPGSAAVGAGIAGIFKGGDVMEVWWIAPDGSVRAAYHEGQWKYYTLAGAGSASLTGSITAVAKGGDVMEVWWIGSQGSVQAAYHEGPWKYYTLAGPGAAAVTGGITSVFKGGDSMEVWWVAPNGSVTGAYHDAEWRTYALSGPGSASPGCRITSAYGGSLVANVMRVWWVDAASRTFQAFFDGQWSISQIGAGAEPSGATVGVLFNPDTPTAVWARSDGSLVDAFPPEITLSARVSGGRGLRGTVWLTLRQDGSTRWHGDVTNHEAYGYNFALSVFAQTGTSADIGAAHRGSVAGWGEPGSSNDIWDDEHQANPMLPNGLAAYRFRDLALKLEHSVDVVDYLKAAIDAIFEVAEGTVLGQFGAVVLVGVEIGSLLATGSLVPGAIIAGGIPWLVGPAGIFVRVLATGTHGGGRQLTKEEYTWANDMVFRGSLPPIDSFRITNYMGAEGRQFTFPTFGGPTLVNVGNAIFTNLHTNEPLVIHELTHVCQIAHSHNIVFTATAMATQLKNELSKHKLLPSPYNYGAAGFDYTHLGLEAQAQVVEDWFLGHKAKELDPPVNPDPRHHTGIRMDAKSDYYRYITDNVRIGLF